jgi:hypothetical protein
MATIEQLSAALVKADAAGNTADAKAFADEIRRLRATAQPTQPSQPSEVPFGRRAIEFVRPTVEALGGVGGAALGTPLGPVGAIGGAGLGYGAAKTGLDVLETALGYRQGPSTALEAVGGGAKDVAVGSVMEGIGRGIVGPAVAKAGEYVSKIKNIKLDTYLQALDNKGDDIIAALRGKPSAVPGAAPTAGEIAAPAGSVRFSALQAQASKVPAMASDYAAMAAQTNQARLAQQGRADAKFQAAAAKAKAKIDRGLTTVSQRETGETLLAAAEAEKEAVKKQVVEPAYAKAFAAAGDDKINVSNVVKEAESILGRELSTFDPSTAPATVGKLLSLQPKAPAAKPVGAGVVSSKLKAPTPPAEAPEVTLAQLDDVRKAINADIAAAARSSDPAAATTLRNLGNLHKSIDEAIEGSATLSDEAKGLYREALNTYRTQYAPRFKTGVNANLFKQTALNEPKLNPDDVVKTYFQPKGEREAQQFVTMFGKNADALKVARSGIEDLYRREVTDAAGRVTPEAHAKFVKKYADPLRILDEAGVNVSQRLDVVAKDAARLAKIQELAEASGNKLAPALPPGANAMAVQKRIDELTQGLTPQQKTHVGAVKEDLLREAEFQRLVQAGAQSEVKVKGLGTETGKQLGLPLPNPLIVAVTIFNNVYKRLALRMDDKIALEIARELTSPALAADSISKAIRLQADRAVTNQLRGQQYGRAATIGAGVEIAPRAEPANYNAFTQPQNALAP